MLFVLKQAGMTTKFDPRKEVYSSRLYFTKKGLLLAAERTMLGCGPCVHCSMNTVSRQCDRQWLFLQQWPLV